MVVDEVLTDEQLRDYELIVIISPEVDEEAFDTVLDNIGRIITDNGGVVTETDKWGKKRLAYPIKRLSEGSYVLFKCQLKPDIGKELETHMRITEEILRFLLIKLGK